MSRVLIHIEIITDAAPPVAGMPRLPSIVGFGVRNRGTPHLEFLGIWALTVFGAGPIDVHGYNPFVSSVVAAEVGARVQSKELVSLDDVREAGRVLQQWRCEHHMLARGVPADFVQQALGRYVELGTEPFVEEVGRELMARSEVLALYEESRGGLEVLCRRERVVPIVTGVLAIEAATG